MTLFWIVCAVLLLVALPFVVLPLWRGAGNDNTGNSNEVLRDAANLEILRDQSAELEADLRNGLLTQDAYEQGKRELQTRLLEEVKTTGQPVIKPRNPAKALAVVLAVLLPLFSVSLYLVIGNTNALLPQENLGLAEGFGVIRSEAKLQELEKKLEQQPENPDGWLLLARSYSGMERFQDAVRAYEQLVRLVPGEAQFWASYADIYAMANDRNLQGEVIRLLDKALALDANNMTALALSGNSAMERGDYVAAINHWQKLLGQLPPDSQDAQMILRGLQQAYEFLALQKGGSAKSAPAPHAQAAQPQSGTAGSQLSGKVSLSPALAGKVAPTDTVFIFARDVQGKKMLLAVLRKQVKDLPLEFTLDDSMAMQPQAKLSGFDRVEVVARVSQSGNPVAQSGDLQGMTGAIKSGAKGLSIVIDSVVQ